MFPEQLKKILNLIKKTGDRVVIFDPSSPESSYVVMDIDRYADMVLGGKISPAEPEKNELNPINKEISEEKENLTEEDLTDKINREISMWKNRENAPCLDEEIKPKKAWSIPPQVKNKAQEIE
jgi:hypothetical protein